MLGKLIKQDFKSVSKLLIPLNAVIIVMTIIGIIIRVSGVHELDNAATFLGTTITTYVLGIIVIAVITYFYPIIHFYRNLFTRQGYLTFTIPVSTWKILFSKTLVGYTWYIASSVIIFFSIWAITGFSTVDPRVMEYWNANFMNSIGMTLTSFLIWLVALGLVQTFFSLVMAFFSISVGQLYAKHKIIASVGVYIGIYMVLQIVVTVISIPFLLTSPSAEAVIALTFYGTAIFSVIASALFYFFSGLILKKKVNLD